MYKVTIRKGNQIIQEVVEDELNSIIHCAEFPKKFKDAGYTIERTKVE